MAAGDNISGKDGKITYGDANTEIKITSFNIKKKTSGVVPVSDSGSNGVMENLPAKYIGFDGSFEGLKKKSVASPDFNTIVAGKFYLDDDSYYSGNVIIQEETCNVSIDGTDAVKVGFTFEGTGALTLTEPAAGG